MQNVSIALTKVSPQVTI